MVEQWNKHLSKIPTPEVALALLLARMLSDLGKALSFSGPRFLLSLTCCIGFSCS